MRDWRKYIAFVFVLVLVGFAFTTADAQTGGEVRFPGNYVLTGDFLDFYLSAPDPQLLFGNAISNVRDENGTPSQYFDRARFELKETDQGLQVQLARLGYFQFDETKKAPAIVIPPSANCRYFPITGHRVCYAFLEFYDEHNGAVYFGNPVSDLIYENGQMVQYFEYARFEYRQNSAEKVGLTNIGRLAMIIKYGTAPITLPSEEIDSNFNYKIRIQARAYVSRALVKPGSGNTLYVVVQDQDLKGMKDAKVNVTTLAGKEAASLPVKVTDEDGIAKFEIDGLNLPSGQTVQLQVVVNYGEKTVKTSTWYRFWY